MKAVTKHNSMKVVRCYSAVNTSRAINDGCNARSNGPGSLPKYAKFQILSLLMCRKREGTRKRNERGERLKRERAVNLLPTMACSWMMVFSSSRVKGPRFMSGLR